MANKQRDWEDPFVLIEEIATGHLNHWEADLESDCGADAHEALSRFYARMNKRKTPGRASKYLRD